MEDILGYLQNDPLTAETPDWSAFQSSGMFTSCDVSKNRIKKKNMTFPQPIKSFIGLSNIQTDKVKN